MLVLARSVGESFILRDRETGRVSKVTVIRSQRGLMRVGIEAPPEVEILRTELFVRCLPAPRRTKP